ncbi:MAG: radical SAM protein [Spirochaetales bacterium]|nr:radical SAM protein [Spirochaetales bacterium]
MRLERAVAAAPPVRDFYFTPSRTSALGLEGVNRELKRRGISCRSFNFPRLNPRGSSIPLPDEYSYLKPFIVEGERGPLSFFTGRKIFGPPFHDAAGKIAEENPDIIFLSLFAWTYADDVLELAKHLRKRLGYSVPIILGGAGASVLPRYFIQRELFDLVMTGETETSLRDLLDHLDKDLPLENFQEKNELTDEPAPLFSFTRDSKGNQFLTLALSRGCPKMCRFCSNFLTQGRRFRLVDLPSLEKEWEQIPYDKGKPIHINLEDDNLLYHKEYFRDFLSQCKTRFPAATFSADNGLDYTLLDEEFTAYLIGRGFRDFSFSLGSADPAVLKEEKRPADPEKLERLLGYLERKGIPVTTFFIAGLPGDTAESVLRTLLYLHELPTRSGISLFYPVPGLPRFEDPALFLSKPPALCSGSSAYPWSGSLSTEELVTAFRLSRFSNFLKSTAAGDEEKQLRDIILETGTLQTFVGKNKNITPLPDLNREMCEHFIKEISIGS